MHHFPGLRNGHSRYLQASQWALEPTCAIEIMLSGPVGEGKVVQSVPMAMSSQSYAATAAAWPLLPPDGDRYPSPRGLNGARKSTHCTGC